ncbi:MAG: hypothetical protein IIY01_03395, partial [Clostridia bacterium]|nr:hypothetical protein [Clostridia bacterium]
LSTLRALPGIAYAEVLAEREGDAYTYLVESELGVDIRKKLFFRLAERNWPLIGLESLGMNLEDIFISVVDKSEERKGARAHQPERQRRRQRDRSRLEQELGESLFEEAKRRRTEESLGENEDE